MEYIYFVTGLVIGAIVALACVAVALKSDGDVMQCDVHGVDGCKSPGCAIWGREKEGDVKGWLEANMAGKEQITRELLEACKKAFSVFDGEEEGSGYYDPTTYLMLEDAIAKAEGKP